MKTHRGWYIPVLAALLALATGTGIGTLISKTLRPYHPSMAAASAAPLAVPSPVELSNSFSRVAAEVEPTVVNINTETTVQVSRQFGGPGGEPLGHLFDHFFDYHNRNGRPENYERRSLGSGIILDPKGYILTNYHVIMQSQNDKPVDRIEVNVQGDDGSKYRATIIGSDKWTDLAVIKINAGHLLEAAHLGDSSAVQVGDWVLAIGSPFGLDSSVTAGIISAKGRDIPGSGMEGQFKRYIQTDAAINPGNSGGPLVNLDGQVVGVNTAIATSQGSNDGVGFAIPSNTARKIYNSLVTSGRVRRGAIGVTFLNQNNPALLRSFGADHGVVVNSVEPGSPADRAGLKMGDVILAIDGRQIRTGDELVQIVSDREIGSTLQLQVLRSGKKLSTRVTVGDRSEIIAEQRAENNPANPGNPVAPTGGMLGMNVQDLSPDQRAEVDHSLRLGKSQGILVTKVVPEGFAADLGLERGDIILALNHRAISSAAEFTQFQTTVKSGDDVLLLIARRTGRSFTTLFLADRLP